MRHERDLARAVRALVASYGLWGYEAADSRRATPGLTDFIILGSGPVLWRELKSPRGVLSRQQTRVRNRLWLADQDWAVWRDADLRSGLIEAQIAARA